MGERAIRIARPLPPAIAFAACAAAAAATATGAAAPLDPAKLAHGYAFAAGQLSATASSLTASQFPTVTSASAGQWNLGSTSDWRAGFFPGQLWRMYEATGASSWRDHAVNWTSPLTTPSINHDHDIGFVTMSSWGQALRLGPTRAYRDDARANLLANAQILAGRFKPSMGFIDSWDNLEEPDGVCIDNMMNLELLLAAHAQGGGQELADVAAAHARARDRWWKEHLVGTFRVIVAREGLTRRNAVIKRIEKKWPGILSSS